MTTPRPFRFGVTTTGLGSRSAWQDRARRLEGEGWSTLLTPDHLGSSSTFAPLVSAADVTTDLRVGSLVVNSDLAHPIRLAQEAATVDLLVDGRLELELGAGWDRREYELLGARYDRPAVRVARLRDAVTTMRAAWAGEVRFPTAEGGPGDRAVLDGVQRPHVPLLIGGHGDAILDLAAAEADIVITGRREAELKGAAVAIGDATAVPGDVSVAADVDRLYDVVRERGRGLDVLFANAGMGVYGASKAAVRADARTWANELAAGGIRVNAISPGPVETPLWDSAFGDRAGEMLKTVAGGVPAGRVGSPDEIAAAVTYLASPESSFVRGIELAVDGGLTQV
jgi:alkanesulfonate monooxygenase SsuD/methylene tetrahydromethanopterin reductase-like flavin-dependent oxidoreductase (luciferase family)